MTSFHDKEKAEENKYAHDQEAEFKIHARRNKLLGLWAAAKMGLEGVEAQTYAQTVALADFGRKSEESVFEKVRHDLTMKGVDISDHDIRAEMHRLLHVARQEAG